QPSEDGGVEVKIKRGGENEKAKVKVGNKNGTVGTTGKQTINGTWTYNNFFFELRKMPSKCHQTVLSSLPLRRLPSSSPFPFIVSLPLRRLPSSSPFPFIVSLPLRRLSSLTLTVIKTIGWVDLASPGS